MKDFAMKLDQERLDRRSAQLRKMIDEANAAADMFCTKGDAETSSLFREVAGHLTMAHSAGRKIKPADPNMPQVQFGGDGK